VHDPVARRKHLRPRRAGLDPLEDRAERIVVGRGRIHRLVDHAGVVRIQRDEVRARAQTLDLTTVERRQAGDTRSDREHREFDRR